MNILLKLCVMITLFKLCGCVLQLNTRSEILYNLAELHEKNLSINANCRSDLKHVVDGIDNREIWALKLLDASGRREPGFVWGHNYWLGSKTACATIQIPVTLDISAAYAKMNYLNLTEIGSKFPVEYRMVYARHYPKLQIDVQVMDRKILHMGFCFPQSCTNEDTMQLSKEMLQNTNFTTNNFLAPNTTTLSTKTLNLRKNFLTENFVIVFLFLFTFNVFCVTFGTVYIGYRQYRKNKIHENLKLQQLEKPNRNNNNNNNNNNNVDEKITQTIVNIKMCTSVAKKVEQADKKEKTSSTEVFFKCFSLVENAKLIKSYNLGRDSIAVIHGIRAIGMVYIILGHMFVYTISGNDNFEMIFLYTKIWILQPVVAVALAVDTYILISALLLSFMFFQRMKSERSNPLVSAGKGIITRYLRLTPSYFMVLVMTTMASKFLTDTSQFWSLENNDENCSKYWWRNILYMNNFYPMNDMCMSWSWYLSVDFQCFVVATILLNVYRLNKTVSIGLFSTIFVGCTIYNGWLGYLNAYSFSVDVQFNTINDLYTPTTSRMPAYIIGIIVGWILFTLKNNTDVFNLRTIRIFWILGPIINLALIYVHAIKHPPILLSVFYTAFGKPLWAIGISWIIIASRIGYGGIIGRILEAKPLIPFSRMTYAVYLINPLIIIFIVMTNDLAFHMDYSVMLVQSMGILTISFLLGYVYMLVFENPFIMLIRTYIERTTHN